MQWLAIAIVVAAALMLIRQAHRSLTGKGGGCSCCGPSCLLDNQDKDDKADGQPPAGGGGSPG
jgi:hypothetical protein